MTFGLNWYRLIDIKIAYNYITYKNLVTTSAETDAALNKKKVRTEPEILTRVIIVVNVIVVVVVNVVVVVVAIVVVVVINPVRISPQAS